MTEPVDRSTGGGNAGPPSPDGPRAPRRRSNAGADAPGADDDAPARPRLERREPAPDQPAGGASSSPAIAAQPAAGPAVAPKAAAAVDLVAQALDAQMRAAAEVRDELGTAGTTVSAPTATPVVVAPPTLVPATTPVTSGTPVPVAASGEATASPLALLVDEPTEVGSDEPSPRGPKAATPPKEGPETGPAEPRSRRRSSRFWRFGYPVIILVITLSVPLLAWAGKKVVLQSTDGKVLTEITDPAAPGYYELTSPTQVLLLVQVDGEGKPNGLTVASLTGEGAGGLIFMPMTTVLDLPDIGKLPLNTVMEKTGREGLQKAVEGILGAGMSDVREVGPQGWADLVAPVAPLTFTNPDDVTVLDEAGQKRVAFPKGELTLEAKDVAAYLATTSPGENDLNRLVRQKAFWEAWLKKVGASQDPNVVPGEKDSGVGKYVRALAGDRVEIFPLPVQGAGIPGSDATVFLPVKDQVAALVARLVPFPIGAPPGARPRVRLLDGTAKLDHGLKAAPLIVEGGGQIDQIGNAPAFGVATTELVYYDEAVRPMVETLQSALGVGTIVKGSNAGSAVDVTVTLGADYLAQPPRQVSTVTAIANGPGTTLVVGVGGG